MWEHQPPHESRVPKSAWDKRVALMEKRQGFACKYEFLEPEISLFQTTWVPVGLNTGISGDEDSIQNT
jgi:hypothetical protein